MAKNNALRLPVVALSAEYLTIGHLMRRNIMAYKAPPNNEGYDLICIHPDARRESKAIRVQVKSRYQTDSDGSVPIREETFGTFDFLVVVFLNIDFFFHRAGQADGRQPPRFLTLPKLVAEEHLYRPPASGFQKLRTRNRGLEAYQDEKGFELIAAELDVPYPSRQLADDAKSIESEDGEDAASVQ